MLARLEATRARGRWDVSGTDGFRLVKLSSVALTITHDMPLFSERSMDLYSTKSEPSWVQNFKNPLGNKGIPARYAEVDRTICCSNAQDKATEG